MKTTFDINKLLQALREVLPNEEKFFALHEPTFNGNEWAYVKDCLDTKWVSSVGNYVDKFEKDLADFTGIKHAVAVVNGTAALHISLLLAGVQVGDEVLIPTLTFVATANAVTYCGAHPHFVDSEENTLGLDPSKLLDHLVDISEMRSGECFNKNTGRRIKAVVPMHTFGHPVDIDPLLHVCEQFNLVLVEDAAESLGSYYKEKHTGNFGLVSALSFNGNKIITTGGGGAILTNNTELAKKAKHLTTTAKVLHKWEYYHDEIGYNYRMPNINAALGCAQLENLPSFIEKKRALSQRYHDILKQIEGINFFVEPANSRSNYWLNSIVLDIENSELITQILENTNKIGIMTRPTWNLLHQLPMFKMCPRMDLSVATSLTNRMINIPSTPMFR